jgi:bifunctional DNA-binding transcriptional regulator/antitoxin component of YhaV-PrlF toxin-antitoxin module
LTCSQKSSILFLKASNTMRMTSKGQVTYPKHISEKLGVRTGDEIGFRDDGPAVLIEGAVAARGTVGNGVVAQLLALGRKHLIRDALGAQTVDEIVEQHRGYGDNANDPGFKRPT